jgi:CBS domain-containing protein
MTEMDPSNDTASETTGTAKAPLASIDSFPYRHRVGELMSAPAVIVDGQTTLDDALRMLTTRKVSSLLVGSGTAARDLGIFTERDVLRAIEAHGADALARSLISLASRPLHAVHADDFAYRAIGRMDRLGLRHLAVTDAAGNVVGMVTTRNLLRHRASRAMVLGDGIDRATTVGELREAWGRLALMAGSLVAEDVDPRAVAAVISAEIQALTRRACEMAEARLKASGWGPPPVPYAMMVLGSAGRGESLLAADQDNAIVYAEGETGGPEDRWFAELGRHVADTLNAVGVPYCKGGVMARNPEWRKSVAAWMATIDDWVRRQSPQDLLNIDIFFDGIGVHGDVRLVDAIWNHAYDRGAATRDFVKLLSLLAAEWKAPLTIFGSIRTDDSGRADLKKGGIMPIFTAARVLSIRHDVRERATPARLDGVAAKGIGAPADFAAVIDAHRTIMDAMLRQQLADAAAGIALSPQVEIGRLDSSAQRRLREALGSVAVATDLVAEGRL